MAPAPPSDERTTHTGAVTRRAVLRWGAGVGVLAAGAACAPATPTASAPSSTTPDRDPGGTGAPTKSPDAGALRALGAVLAAGPDAAALRAARPAGTSDHLGNDEQVVAFLATLDADVRHDFATGRTVLAEGWLLAEREAAVLVAYARA